MRPKNNLKKFSNNAFYAAISNNSLRLVDILAAVPVSKAVAKRWFLSENYPEYAIKLINLHLRNYLPEAPGLKHLTLSGDFQSLVFADGRMLDFANIEMRATFYHVNESLRHDNQELARKVARLECELLKLEPPTTANQPVFGVVRRSGGQRYQF